MAIKTRFPQMKNYLPALLAGWLGLVPAAAAQSGPAFRLPSPDSLRRWMARSHVPTVGLALIEGGRVRRVRVLGELQPSRPASRRTLFPVASLTKPLVTLTVLQLAQRGKWHLDEPLAHYWTDPDLAADPRLPQLTTRLVLSHQTGLPNWRWQTPTHRLTFLHDPGTTYGYSGEGFEYLRQALEHKFKRTLPQLSDSLVLHPLGLADTRYSYATDPDLDSARLAGGHDERGNVLRTPRPAAPNAADGLVSTVGDYAAFGAWVLAGAGLSDSLFHLMTTPQVATGPPGQGMSLGWQVLPIRNRPADDYLLLHSGRDEGLFTLIVLLPRSRRGVVLFTNGDRGADVAVSVLRSVLNLPELTP